MITGVHFLLYSKEPEGDRAFLRDVLGFHSVDAGGGWLIFTLPPDVLGAVPYLMCDDLAATVHSLGAAGGACPQPVEEDWGVVTTVRLPGGGELGLYQPKHPTAV
jgi:hypothetical protein